MYVYLAKRFAFFIPIPLYILSLPPFMCYKYTKTIRSRWRVEFYFETGNKSFHLMNENKQITTGNIKNNVNLHGHGLNENCLTPNGEMMMYVCASQWILICNSFISSAVCVNSFLIDEQCKIWTVMLQ